jgi:ABC-type lipoprotein release transport system permease subunit
MLDPGFQAKQVDVFSLAVDLNGYRKGRAVQYYRELMARISAVPGVAPSDPATLGGLLLALVLVAAVAIFVPARRASHVNPMDALRNE